jgi:hypothetical protein
VAPPIRDGVSCPFSITACVNTDPTEDKADNLTSKLVLLNAWGIPRARRLALRASVAA